MRWLLLCFLGSFTVSVVAQSRIAMEANCTFVRGYLSAFYCPVVFQHYYIKSGVSWGNFGRDYVEVNAPGTDPAHALPSPYKAMNRFSDSLMLEGFFSRNNGFSVEAGLGRFWELTPIHTFRLDFQVKWYAMEDRIGAFYVHNSDPEGDLYLMRFKIWHYGLSFGPEVFHAIRVSPRLTVYYGLKLPFLIALNSDGYQNQSYSMPTKGLRPNLTLGLSCALGKKQIDR